MSYTPSYVKPYPEGYKNEPIETTPITAEVMNGYDDAIENIENYLADGEMGTVVVANPEIEGTEPNLTALQVGEDKFKIPSGGSASIDYGDEESFDEWSENAQNGEIFVRTDDNEGGGSGGGTAKSVSYDNSVSELEATNVQDAIDEVFTSVSNGKTLIADAITDKGIETSATDTFVTMAEHIGQISGGGGSSRILDNSTNTYTSSGTFVPWTKYGDIPDMELSSDYTTITCNFSGTFDLRILFRFERGASASTITTQTVIYVNDVLSRSISTPVTPYYFHIMEVKDFVIANGDNIKIGKVNDGKGYLYLYSVEFLAK